MKSIIRRFRRSFAILPVVIGLLSVGAVHPAQAGRLVGIVFDDSGSMGGRINLPAFGTQLLVSTLDGRPGHDKLFTIRLSTLVNAARSAPLAGMLAGRLATPDLIADINRLHLPDLPRLERIETPAAHKALLDTIQKDWAKATASTPYEPVELMLSHLVDSTGPDDEAFLVIVTDGAFFDGSNISQSPGPAELAKSYQGYKARLKGRLRVDFVLIDGGNDDSGKVGSLQEKVDEQGVRSALLRTFNGSETDGRHDVKGTALLRQALLDIIARVSSTDRSDRRDMLRIDGEKVVINSPLSITRIISIITGVAGEELPRAIDAGSGRTPTLDLESAMAKSDTAPRWQNERLNARTAHFRMFPAQPPGELTLRYDRPVGKDVVLLFDTGVRLDLAVHDGNGNRVPPGPDGVVDVAKGHPYTVNGTLMDEGGTVDFKTIPASATFSAWTDRDGGRSGFTFVRDNGANRASGVLPTAQVGDYQAGGTFHLPGFVIKESNRLKIRVVESNVQYSLKLDPIQPCPGCGPNELHAEMRSDVGDQPVARLTLTQTAGTTSNGLVSMDGMPDWLVLKDAGGATVPPNRPLALNKDAPTVLTLEQQLTNIRDIGSRRMPFAIHLRAQAPHSGEAALAGLLTVGLPDVSIAYVGNSRTDTPNEPLALTPDDIEAASQSMYFEVRGTPVLPKVEDIVVKAAGGLLTFDVQVSDHRVSLVPKSEWCTCLLWAFAPDKVTVGYRSMMDVPPVEVSAPLRFTPSIQDLVRSCLGLLALVLLALYLVMVIRVFFTTHRFPKRSMAQIQDRDGGLPRFEDLPQWSWRSVSCLWLKHAHARRSVSGVLLEARPGGAKIILADSDPAFIVERLGQSLGELRREQPNLREIALSWGERLGRPRGPKALMLMREFQN